MIYTTDRTYRVEVAPYWNVNESNIEDITTEFIVEVAPYWNVNTQNTKAYIPGVSGRSSSILECKYGYLGY